MCLEKKKDTYNFLPCFYKVIDEPNINYLADDDFQIFEFQAQKQMSMQQGCHRRHSIRVRVLMPSHFWSANNLTLSSRGSQKDLPNLHKHTLS